jgi:hypothetical protein
MFNPNSDKLSEMDNEAFVAWLWLIERRQISAMTITNRRRSPRYDVIQLPKVGDDCSYAFNGDYYPCGQVKSISKSLKIIVTTEGQKFYRRGETGTWKYNKTWSLVKGHISKLNPEF